MILVFFLYLHIPLQMQGETEKLPLLAGCPHEAEPVGTRG